MTTPYLSTSWVVKPGLEDEFVARWSEVADWTAAHGLAAAAMLLRDVEQPNRFISFGPWLSVDAIRQWRAGPEFHERVARLHDVVDSFEPLTLEVVAETGGRRRRAKS
jgi:heme-degrading monooxygenase HmoA